MPSDTRLWHPFSDMHAVRAAEFTIARAEGVWVWDDAGRRYLDGTASLWNVNIGHARRELIDAAHAQMQVLATYQTFGANSNAPAHELAERLCSIAPMDDPRVFLTSGGGDSIDTAAKLARRYFTVVGQPDRMHLISRTQGYHGTHGVGTSIGGIPANRAGVGPLDPHTSQVPHDSLEALEAEIERVGADRVAAVFVEPVIGAGGVHQPRPGYIEGVAALCERTGVLLVIDAVISGFGRLGEWYGPERFGVRPDLMVFAKGVTSGYLPLGGVLANGRVAAPFWEESGNWMRHGPTYAGHPTVCAVALANLDVIEREGVRERARELEGELAAALAPFAEHPLVGEVRAGVGALAAVALDPQVLERHAGAQLLLAAQAKERGVLVRPLGDAIALSPPLIITAEQVDLAATVLGESLDAVATELGAAATA